MVSATDCFVVPPRNDTFFVGFALTNNYFGKYADGHGIRRDGDGKFPPVEAYPQFDFTHPKNREALKAAYFPKNFKKRININSSVVFLAKNKILF